MNIRKSINRVAMAWRVALSRRAIALLRRYTTAVVLVPTCAGEDQHVKDVIIHTSAPLELQIQTVYAVAALYDRMDGTAEQAYNILESQNGGDRDDD